MTTSQREPAEPVGDEDRWLDDEPDEELPPRPRRRLLAPVPLALSAILIAAAGFIGGVVVQKGQSSSGTGSPGGFPAALGAAAGREGQSGAAPDGTGAGAAASGEVSSVKGNVLYVTDDDGTTVKVTVPSGASVTRSAQADARDVHPGDTVVVQGATRANGSVKASSVSATAPGVDLGSLLGGFGAPGGSSGGGGGNGSAGQPAGDDVGSLFGG